MTLDAAIEYWTKKAKENEQKYGQLVMWLEELKVFREEDKLKKVKKWNTKNSMNTFYTV